MILRKSIINDKKRKDRRKYKLELKDLQSDAVKAGLEYLETIPILTSVKTRYRCKNCNDILWKRPNNVQKGQGCAKCHRYVLNPLKNLQSLQSDADKVGLEYLEINAISAHAKAHYKCKTCGYDWWKVPNDVQKGSGCPKCKINKHERICHQIFESIFNTKFKQSARPNWLCLKKGHQLHLDGFCKELQLAFEYNGPQHYEPGHFNSSFKDQQIRDEIKATRCIEHGVTLIVVPYWIKPSEMQNFIKNEYKRLIKKNTNP
jgi:transposase-like protein